MTFQVTMLFRLGFISFLLAILNFVRFFLLLLLLSLILLLLSLLDILNYYFLSKVASTITTYGFIGGLLIIAMLLIDTNLSIWSNKWIWVWIWAYDRLIEFNLWVCWQPFWIGILDFIIQTFRDQKSPLRFCLSQHCLSVNLVLYHCLRR